jgi:NTE family protein
MDDRLYIQKANFARTIPISTLGIRTTDFTIDREKAQALYEAGRKASEKFLANWDFSSYVATFRRAQQHSRRTDIVEEMRASNAG